MEYKNYKEVFEQGIALKKTFEHVCSFQPAIKKLVEEYDPQEIVFLACGSSYWLSSSAALTWQRDTGIRSSAIMSGDVVLEPDVYRKAYKRPLVIAPSRSGMTSETLIAMDYFKEWYNCKTISITEYEENDMLDRSDIGIQIVWANEESVCQTQSFSNLYLSCILLSAFLSGNTSLKEDLAWYIEQSLTLAKDIEEKIRDLIKFPFTSLVTLGSGCEYGVACEGAYIVVEVAQFLSGTFGALDYRHGPIVTADEGSLISIFSSVGNNELEQGLITQVKGCGAKIMAISATHTFNDVDWSFCLNKKVAREVVALYGIMIMQGVAYYTAIRNNVNPDAPGELIPYISI